MTIGMTSLVNMSGSRHQHPMVRGSAEAAVSASATTIATGTTTGGAATTNARGTTRTTIGAAEHDLRQHKLRRGRGSGKAGQRERGY